MADTRATASPARAVSAPKAGGSFIRATAAFFAFATLLLVVIQFALAAYGSFGGEYAAHSLIGRAIPVSAALLLVATLIARAAARFIAVGSVLVILVGPTAFILAGLAWDGGPWVGALHGLNGAVAAVLNGMMTRVGRI